MDVLRTRGNRFDRFLCTQTHNSKWDSTALGMLGQPYRGNRRRGLAVVCPAVEEQLARAEPTEHSESKIASNGTSSHARGLPPPARAVVVQSEWSVLSRVAHAVRRRSVKCKSLHQLPPRRSSRPIYTRTTNTACLSPCPRYGPAHERTGQYATLHVMQTCPAYTPA